MLQQVHKYIIDHYVIFILTFSFFYLELFFLALDLMLRCVSKLEPHSQFERQVLGVVLALCCHHRCTWQSYVGKAFFESCGLSARQFHIMSSMCGWATCSTRPNRKGWSVGIARHFGDHDTIVLCDRNTFRKPVSSDTTRKVVA